MTAKGLFKCKNDNRKALKLKTMQPEYSSKQLPSSSNILYNVHHTCSMMLYFSNLSNVNHLSVRISSNSIIFKIEEYRILTHWPVVCHICQRRIPKDLNQLAFQWKQSASQYVEKTTAVADKLYCNTPQTRKFPFGQQQPHQLIYSIIRYELWHEKHNIGLF